MKFQLAHLYKNNMAVDAITLDDIKTASKDFNPYQFGDSVGSEKVKRREAVNEVCLYLRAKYMNEIRELNLREQLIVDTHKFYDDKGILFRIE